VLDDPAGKGEQLVQQELGTYAGISGVPHFVINGRCVVRRLGEVALRGGLTGGSRRIQHASQLQDK
jgi:hypothetical protein